MKNLISLVAIVTVLLSGCGSPSDSSSSELSSVTKEALGKSLFFDQNISLTRKTSCATCHNPEHAFIDDRFSKTGINQTVFINGAFSVGDDGSSLGGRNAPTATYAQFIPTFSKANDGNYSGGQFHDGRAATLAVQAAGPPLDAAEMQMSDKNAVVDRLKENSTYVNVFQELYGSVIFDDINASYAAMAESIAAFENTDLFSPFNSKYDKFRDCREAGKSTTTCFNEGNWTNEEDQGYSLFFSSANTNCAKCHSINSNSEAVLGQREMFTNFKYENIGTPRNITAMDARAALGLQASDAVFKGLGGVIESTDVNFALHLGKSKVPTLRNIAVTAPYMSNGVFSKLRTVLEFYDHQGVGNRVNNPETGAPWIANDNNLTVNRGLLGSTQELSDSKIKALEAFLRTLTDKPYESLLEPLAP